jgi:hypothetical protein
MISWLTSLGDATDLAEVRIELREAIVPVRTELIGPCSDLLEWLGFEVARATLGVACLAHETRSLQYLEVLRDRRQLEVEGSGELVDRGVTLRETMQDGATSWVGEGREREAEWVVHVLRYLAN